jgi:hypothetical protein
MRVSVVTVAIVLTASTAYAQSEAALKQFFEGRSVVVKLDMPATSAGVDVYPQDERPIDYSRYADRLKVGVALKPGDSIMVTRIRMRDKHIEFHLGGGGFDEPYVSTPYVATPGKSDREKDLEREVKNERDPARKRTLQQELDRLRRERERDQRQADATRAANEAAAEAKKARFAEQRLHAGSRFNVRYRNGVPPGITPAMVMRALAEYLDFPFADSAPAGRPGAAAAADPPASAPGALRKGLSVAEVEGLLGKAERSTDRMEGKLKVTTAVFLRDDQRIEAEFVEGVLIRYAISSR